MKTKKSSKVKSKIVFCLLLIFFLFIVYKSFTIIRNNNFGNYIFSEKISGYSVFVRDYFDIYSNQGAYVIQNKYLNDAMISKKIKVEKDTPYKISCYMKVEDVIADGDQKGIGAMLSIVGDTQTSRVMTGTSEYEYVEMYFNSKQREEIELGVRLGGNLGKAKGVVKFCNMTLEKGENLEPTNTWRVGYFIFPETHATVSGVDIDCIMSEDELSYLKDTINRFEQTTTLISNGKIQVENKLFYIDSPITSLTYDNEFGYHAESYDIDDMVRPLVETNQFDHIFVVLKTGKANDGFSHIVDWLGLGGMEYGGVGFSNLRLPEDENSYYYKYDPLKNTYPEEILLHEFLHTFEKMATDYGYERPELHDYAKYGYKNEKLIGTQHWFYAYINKEIEYEGELIGLPEEIFVKKPAGKDCFSNSVLLDYFKEPEGLIENAKYILQRIKYNL